MKALLSIKIPEGRTYGLDLLRAWAILFVIIEHGNYLLPINITPIFKIFFGYDGVSIFFVLSGYLIGGILFKIWGPHLEPTHSQITKSHLLLNFLVRRWFRTLPAYFLILLTLLILSKIFIQDFSILENWKYFLLIQNLNSPHPSFFPEAWSLTIEEWFYIIISVLFLINSYFVNSAKSFFLLVILGTIVGSTLFRYYVYLNTGINSFDDWDLLIRKQIFTRFDNLMFGVLGAFFNYYYYKKWVIKKSTLAVLGIIILISTKMINVLVIVNHSNLYSCVFSFSIQSLSTFLLLPYLSELKYGFGICHQIFTRISLMSYSMYLINLSIIQYWLIDTIKFELIINNLVLSYVIKYILYWTLVIILSILLYKYFEIPTTKIRDIVLRNNNRNN